MIIEDGHGNLLAADADALVNTVNTVGIMGKGIALQFKRAYPANYRAYRSACARGDVQLGRMFVFDTGLVGPRRYIINFPTKQHWRNPSRVHDIQAGLDDLVDVVAQHGITSIAIPALGCGNGGLAWSDVRPAIEQACARMVAVRAIIFAPEGAPAPATMPNATPRPELTKQRALLLVAISRYLDRARLQEVRNGASELEIQKLAYFLQLLGTPLRLGFNRGRYGPYAPALSNVLDKLEGHYLVGYGDRSASVSEFAPINPLPAGAKAAYELLDQHPQYADRVDALLDLVDGFETPYSLELLATVHFAAEQDPPTAQTTVIAERVAAWSLRKARMFTDRHVQIAAERLREHQLLPNQRCTVRADH
ncbi:MAG TPA: macro domain-containing protein [Catenuloplanes sp.]|jgi:O-acetyl-ADP-ribose deacetylase (regulator of RNase III)